MDTPQRTCVPKSIPITGFGGGGAGFSSVGDDGVPAFFSVKKVGKRK
jgi:hypothetical protein